jgi:hypothetical protein
MTTAYIVIAVKFLEERDLLAQYGDTYRDYQRRVPMLLPWTRRGLVEADTREREGVDAIKAR